MSDIVINGVTYSGVDSITVYKTNGETTTYTEGSGNSENKLAEFLSNKNITINASDFGDATQIRQYSFYGSNIVEVEMPDTITSIGNYAFYSCGMMMQCKLSKNLTSIGSNAFTGSGIMNIDLPSGLKSIGSNAFQYSNSLKNIIIPSSLTSFGNYSFQNCPNLTSVVIQEGVTSIGNYTFQSCQKLVELVIPTTITQIGGSAFQSCTSLKNLTIPSGVKTLNSNVFGNCSSLEKVSFLENSQLTTISSGAFYLCSKVSLYDFRNCTKVPSLANLNALQHSVGCQIVVPDALYDTWTTASVWSTLTDIVWVKASEYVEA